MAFALTGAAPAAAQQWSVDAQAGRMRSELDPSGAGFGSAAVGIRYEQFTSLFRLAGGIPTTGEQPLWFSVAGSHRLAARPGSFVTGVDLSGNGFLLHDRVQRVEEVRDVFQQRRITEAPQQSGFAGAVQAMPVLGFETPTFQAHVRGGVSHYVSEFAEQRRTRNVKVADAQLTLVPSASIALMPAVRHFIAEEGDYTYAGVTAATGTGAFSAWGSTGRWLNLEDQALTFAAGASVRLHDRVNVTASSRRDVIDPQYGTPGQTSWSVGLTLKLGKVPPSRVPAPAVFDAGLATIRLPAAQSSAPPRLAGDFTEWKPQPMQRVGDAWVYSVKLQPGVYNYAFVDATGDWFVPEKYPGRKSDGMGGEVAVLVVR